MYNLKNIKTYIKKEETEPNEWSSKETSGSFITLLGVSPESFNKLNPDF